MSLARSVGLELLYATNFCDFFASEWRAHAKLLEKMRVLPERSGESISEEEWEVAHTYMAVAFRKLPSSGAEGGGVPPAARNPGHIRMDPDRDILHLEAGGGASVAGADASAGAKRGPPAAAAGGGDGKRSRGGEREAVKYDDDALFD